MRVHFIILAVLIMTAAVYSGRERGRLAPQDRRLLEVRARPGEALIHTSPGAEAPGAPAVIIEGRGVDVVIRVIDTETGAPTAARVNVIGADGNYYFPDEQNHHLAEYSLHRTGNREGKGPFRYYGWFFYATVEATVRVPPGRVRVEAWKGFEFQPVRVDVDVALGSDPKPIIARLKRVSRIEQAGYVSGDTHLHFTRDGQQRSEERLLDLLDAEDIRVGFILAMNDPRGYSPRMEDQIWPQASFGAESVRWRSQRDLATGDAPTHGRDARATTGARVTRATAGAGVTRATGPTLATDGFSAGLGYTMISSQEYRANTFGHILMLGGERLVQGDGIDSDPNHWPPFGLVADELHRMGGFAFHAHGGYAKGIYGDFAQRKTDGVELLQFAEYRGIGLEGWYHILNAGYRFPGIGASDYPYCRALGDCRTYVRVPAAKRGDAKQLVRAWIEGAAAGRSFFTTGPLVQFAVGNHLPGDVVDLRGPHAATASVQIESPVARVTDLHLLVNGEVVRHERLSGEGPWQKQWPIQLDKPAWVALRAYSRDPMGRRDAEVHTNPVYFTFAGRNPRIAASIDWLIEQIDRRIRYHAARDFSRQQDVIAYFRRSREALEHLRAAGD